MAKERAGIEKLSDDLLLAIFDYLDPDPEPLVSIERRAYLSRDSVPNGDDSHEEKAKWDFRLVCSRFARIKIPRHFVHVVTRFTQASFEDLAWLLRQEYLVKHARTFTYMVPSFYVEDGWHAIREILKDTHAEPEFIFFQSRYDHQKELIRSGRDVTLLRQAFAAFSSLQNIKLLKVQNESEVELKQFAEKYRIDLFDWRPACTQAIQTLSIALLQSNSPCQQFSGRQISPQATLSLLDCPQETLRSIVRRLTCLEINFVTDTYIDQEIELLSRVFQTAFQAGDNLEALHVGFPSWLPLSIDLEEVFQNVQLKKLRAFGIQGWRLRSNEINEFVRRHQKTLRGLRLRDVYLKDGSMWTDVLPVLRYEAYSLEWVSLRRINYAKAFDEMYSGIEIGPDDFSESDSDDEGLFDAHISDDGDEEEQDHQHHDDDQASSLGEESDGEDNHSDDEHGLAANRIELSPDTSVSSQFQLHLSSINSPVDGLGDNGESVTREQWKFWERWVIPRFPNPTFQPRHR